MGANNSPIMAECVMRNIDNEINTSAYKPKFYCRFYDDLFIIIKKSQLKDFEMYINSLRSYIRFTIESEVNNEIHFLDVLVQRNQRTFKTKVYRKDSHSNRYLNYNSYNPLCHKKSVVYALVQRAFNIISDVQDIATELNYIRQILINNNYPLDIINNVIKDTKPKTVELPNTSSTAIPKPLVLPYIQVHHKSNKQIKHFFNNKAIKQNTNVIYEINCKDCVAKYVGQTKRDLFIRVKEHRDAIFTDPNKSAVAAHSVDNQHSVNYNFPKILCKCKNESNRKFMEN
ncbi:reverse transcriptase-like protein, partial [Leptotrombidium deliense]